MFFFSFLHDCVYRHLHYFVLHQANRVCFGNLNAKSDQMLQIKKTRQNIFQASEQFLIVGQFGYCVQASIGRVHICNKTKTKQKQGKARQSKARQGKEEEKKPFSE